MIHNLTLVDAMESSSLDPRIWKVLLAVFTKQKHAANGRHMSALMGRHQPQRLQIGPPKPANRCKQLGSSSEVEGFRVQSWHRLLVIRLAASKAAQFVDQVTVGPPGRA